MVNTVLFVPRAGMLLQAKKIEKNYHLKFLHMKEISTSNARKEAENAIEAGAEIIIARGMQATLIKKHVSVPVVEIFLTGQEMGQLIMKAKATSNKQCPTIGVIGFSNMFCDMSSFNDLYGVDLREYYVDESEQLSDMARQACLDSVDAVIGGDLVCQYAQTHDLPAIFQMSGVESIAEAFRVAEKVAFAIDLEKKNTAEFKTLLDYSFNGIIELSTEGIVLHTNNFVEKLLSKSEPDMIGLQITELVPEIESNMLEQVLKEGLEIYSTVFIIHKTAVVTNIAPILVEGLVRGAILSFHEGRRVAEMEAEMRKELYQKGYVAEYTFDTLIAKSPQAQVVMERAMTYAKFNAPILILGEDGTEKKMLAQCIHNAGVFQNESFVSLSCDALPQDKLEETLFGHDAMNEGPYKKGLVDWADGGTLFLDKVSKLDFYTQFRLNRLIRDQVIIRENNIWPSPTYVRVIAADTQDLISLVEQGSFREDLYYSLNVLSLMVTPLKERPEDVKGWLEYFISVLETKYQRYIHITAGAIMLLQEYEWNGNLPEIYSFCERLVILSSRRTVNESIVRSLMDTCPPVVHKGLDVHDSHMPYGDEKSAQLVALLEKHHGKRRLVAQEMNISTTTLWRYMKKYGICDE